MDSQVSNAEVVYQTQPQGNLADEYFHFDSLKPLNLLPNNLFTLRVTCLNDATLLGFRIPHHFCDGESVYHVIQGYCDIVAGQKCKTLINPPDVEFPLSKFLEKNTKFPLPAGLGIDDVPFLHPNEKLLTGIRPWVHYVGYAVAKMIGAKLGLAQKSEEKLVHLPGPMVDQWRKDCEKESDDAGTEAPRLSNLDIITAWFLKVSYSAILVFRSNFSRPPCPKFPQTTAQSTSSTTSATASPSPLLQCPSSTLRTLTTSSESTGHHSLPSKPPLSPISHSQFARACSKTSSQRSSSPTSSSKKLTSLNLLHLEEEICVLPSFL